MYQKDQLIKELEELKAQAGEREANRLDLPLAGRLALRMDSFSSGCAACGRTLAELHKAVHTLKDGQARLDKSAVKEYQLTVKRSVSHLQKKHKLVTEGYYLGVFLSLGISLGLVYGLVLLDNVALGLPFGLCIGLAVGASLDADAKKKGKTI